MGPNGSSRMMRELFGGLSMMFGVTEYPLLPFVFVPQKTGCWPSLAMSSKYDWTLSY